MFASGCTTVVKPSSTRRSRRCGSRQILAAAGLPPGVFNVVTGLGPTTGKALAQHPGVNKFVLTGGTDAGASSRGCRAQLCAPDARARGKTPSYRVRRFRCRPGVNYAAFGASSAPVRLASAPRATSCTSAFTRSSVEKLARKRDHTDWRPARPESPTRPGHLGEQRERVLSYVRIGIEEGARRRRAERRRPTPKLACGFFVEPTVFADVKPHMRIAREEVFGHSPSCSRSPLKKKRSQSPTIRRTSGGGDSHRQCHAAHRVAAKLRCGIVW